MSPYASRQRTGKMTNRPCFAHIQAPPIARQLSQDPLSHCVFCGIADYRCYTPTSFSKMAFRNPKTGLGGWVSQTKLASEAYCAMGGTA